MEFDWDDTRWASNIEKHGIDFDDAVKVFADPLVLTSDVTLPEHGETRFKTVGSVDGRVMAVIFTDRGPVRRIISARWSRRNERREYDHQSEIAR